MRSLQYHVVQIPLDYWRLGLKLQKLVRFQTETLAIQTLQSYWTAILVGKFQSQQLGPQLSLGSDAGIELRIQRIDEFDSGDYRFDSANDSAKVSVTDKIIPELSIGDAQLVHAGNDAEFVITSTSAYTGTVEITFTPENTNGNFLDESDGTDTTKENTNSGIARTATLTYNNETTRTITIATVDDPADNDGGIITVTLNDDPAAVLDDYTVSSAQGANVGMVNVAKPLPEVSITGGDIINEGQNAIFTVSTDESDTTRTDPIVVNVSASESGTNFLAGTHEPTVTILGGSTTATYEVPTTNDGLVGGKSGYVTALVGTGTGYELADTGISASVGVRDNAGTRQPVAYISDATTTGEGNEMIFTIELTKFPARNSRTRVEYSVHTSSTAEVDKDFTLASSYVELRGSYRQGPFQRPGQRTAQIRVPIIHDSVDELDETIVIELTSANNGFNVDSFESQASGTITDHANDVVMVSVENSAGLEGDSGTNNIPVTLTLNIPSSRDIEVDWVTSESASGTNKASDSRFRC